MSIEAKKLIDELTEKLNYYSNKYYMDDSPEISDYEYDMLQRQLKELELQYPQYAHADSPTSRVGGGVEQRLFTPVEHRVKMESLQDVFNFDELRSFLSKLDLDKTELSVEPKIDGLSVSLEYRDGLFFRGSTRGDGVTGEDVTANLLQIKSVPKAIKFMGELEVRGEVYMPKESFLRLFVQPLPLKRISSKICLVRTSKPPFILPQSTILFKNFLLIFEKSSINNSFCSTK